MMLCFYGFFVRVHFVCVVSSSLLLHCHISSSLHITQGYFSIPYSGSVHNIIIKMCNRFPHEYVSPRCIIYVIESSFWCTWDQKLHPKWMLDNIRMCRWFCCKSNNHVSNYCDGPNMYTNLAILWKEERLELGL